MDRERERETHKKLRGGEVAWRIKGRDGEREGIREKEKR